MSISSIALSSSVTPSAPARRISGLRTRLAMVVAVATLAVAWGGLVLTHAAQPPVIPRAAALHAIFSDAGLRRMLARDGWQRVEITPMDSHYEELGFYRGARLVATVTVGRTARGIFIDATDLTKQKY